MTEKMGFPPTSLTALRFRDSPTDIIRRTRVNGPERPRLFGGFPFYSGDFRRLFGATDVNRASIMLCSVGLIITWEKMLSRGREENKLDLENSTVF